MNLPTGRSNLCLELIYFLIKTPENRNNLKQSKLQKKLTQSVTVFLSLLISQCLYATTAFFHPFEEKEAKLVGCNLQKKSFTLK